MYFLDLLGTFAFAVTGAYKAKSKNLHIIGVVFFGIITAFGGGTFRDIIISKLPLFYLSDPSYLLVAVLGGIFTYFLPAFLKKAYSFFRFIDSLGLAAFVIIGTFITYTHLYSAQGPSLLFFLPTVFLGMLTGFGGGIIRDAIMGDMPFSLKHGSNYATSAFWGATVFYILMFVNEALALYISLITILVFREIISKYGIYKKILRCNRI